MKISGAILESMAMFTLVIVYNSLHNSKMAPQHISSVSIAMVYLITISSSYYHSGGCLNVAFLLGPSIMSKNQDDWLYYTIGQLLGGMFGAILFYVSLKKKKSETVDPE